MSEHTFFMLVDKAAATLAGDTKGSNLELQELVASILPKDKWRIDPFTNVELAEKAFDAPGRNFGAVLLNVDLPRSWPFCAFLKRNYPDMPVIVVSEKLDHKVFNGHQQLDVRADAYHMLPGEMDGLKLSVEFFSSLAKERAEEELSASSDRALSKATSENPVQAGPPPSLPPLPPSAAPAASQGGFQLPDLSPPFLPDEDMDFTVAEAIAFPKEALDDMPELPPSLPPVMTDGETDGGNHGKGEDGDETALEGERFATLRAERPKPILEREGLSPLAFTLPESKEKAASSTAALREAEDRAEAAERLLKSREEEIQHLKEAAAKHASAYAELESQLGGAKEAAKTFEAQKIALEIEGAGWIEGKKDLEAKLHESSEALTALQSSYDALKEGTKLLEESLAETQDAARAGQEQVNGLRHSLDAKEEEFQAALEKEEAKVKALSSELENEKSRYAAAVSAHEEALGEEKAARVFVYDTMVDYVNSLMQEYLKLKDYAERVEQKLVRAESFRTSLEVKAEELLEGIRSERLQGEAFPEIQLPDLPVFTDSDDEEEEAKDSEE